VVAKSLTLDLVIGSGGNINKLLKLSELPPMKILKNAKTESILKINLESFT